MLKVCAVKDEEFVGTVKSASSYNWKEFELIVPPIYFEVLLRSAAGAVDGMPPEPDRGWRRGGCRRLPHRPDPPGELLRHELGQAGHQAGERSPRRRRRRHHEAHRPRLVPRVGRGEEDGVARVRAQVQTPARGATLFANWPLTSIFMFLALFCHKQPVASTCSTSEVPIPKANAPRAP